MSEEISNKEAEELLKEMSEKVEKLKKEAPQEFTKKDMEFLMSEDGLKRYYGKIEKILKKYMDLDEEFYPLVATWIIGTYLHKQFSSYPYLYFNAMKGSGKTRMLKIISGLSKQGKLVGSMTEAVLFRTASKRTLCIDELENINAKGSENLKLLLNSAYKKGLDVERLDRVKGKKGDKYEITSYKVYCPIALANIWGLGNVLADRSISVILEKSSNNRIIKLIENFEDDIEFKTTRGGLIRLTENLKDDQGLFSDIFNKWNFYQRNVVNKVSKVSEVSIVNKVKDNIVNKEKEKSEKNDDFTYKTYDINDINDNRGMFQKIDDTNLSGRDLELFFPIFIVADMISEDLLEKLLELSKKIVEGRKESDREDNNDVKLIEFIAQSEYKGYIAVAKIVNDLKEVHGEEERWINSRGISRALGRLKLRVGKPLSTGKRKTIKLDVEKAKQKLLMFKEPEEDQKIEVVKVGADKNEKP